MQSKYGNFNVNIPFSIVKTLKDNKIIEDPYYRDNESKISSIFKENYLLKNSFILEESDLNYDITLNISKLDTYSHIKINNHFLKETINFHIDYLIKIPNEYLKKGLNEIEITLFSPYSYIDKVFDKDSYFYGYCGLDQNFPYIRKPHSSFGWDWGIVLPDSGIYNHSYIDIQKSERIIDFNHKVTISDEFATLSLNLKFDSNKNSKLKLELYSPSNELIYENIKDIELNNKYLVNINNPELWYPNGYGKQPLYKIVFTIININETYKKEYKIGLKELVLNNKETNNSIRMEFYINKKKIFLKGANYIPMDAIYPNVDEFRIRKLLSLVKDFNHNSIRVWGGGEYPKDIFYEICDEYGILVVHDLMFACATYDSRKKEFIDTIKEEIRNQINRIKNHVSLIMFYGNNECEEMLNRYIHDEKEKKNKMDSYLEIFTNIIPSIIKEETDIFYLSSSPTSGKPFIIDSQNDDYYDRHSWEVWHASLPIEYYYNVNPMFLSEFGLQSFASNNLISSFTIEEDRFLDSKVMNTHQKNNRGNELIFKYIKDRYHEPKDFRSLIYLSQLSQEEAIDLCVRHLRTNNKTSGSFYWQLNDNWPVQSWSSIDYGFNLKMLHYASKNFYNKLVLTFKPKGDDVTLYVNSEDYVLLNLKVKKLNIFTNESTDILYLKDKLLEGTKELITLSINDLSDDEIYYAEASDIVNAYYFKNKPKDIMFKNPMIEIIKIKDKTFNIKAKEFAYHVFLETTNSDVIFSNNSFNLFKGEVKTIETNIDIDIKDINIMSLYDSYN